MKNKREFYANTNSRCKCSVGCVCKDCAKKVALRIDIDGVEHGVTKESCIEALRLLNKPFKYTVWNGSVAEAENENTGKKKNNAWNAYVKNIAME